MAERVALLAGGNMGDVGATLRRAEALLEQRVGHVEHRSAYLRSEAWGFESPDEFLNAAYVCLTELEPEALLDVVNDIEAELGRDREAEARQKSRSGAKYLSRVIDIDIIFYGQRVISTPRLQVPHPLMQQREFVLRPLAEVCAQWQHPVEGRSVAELLARKMDRKD